MGEWDKSLCTGAESNCLQSASLMRASAIRRASGDLLSHPGICDTAGQATTACRLHLNEALHWQTYRSAVWCRCCHMSWRAGRPSFKAVAVGVSLNTLHVVCTQNCG